MNKEVREELRIRRILLLQHQVIPLCSNGFFNREIIGWAMERRLKRQLVIDACERAILKRRPDEDLIYQS